MKTNHIASHVASASSALLALTLAGSAVAAGQGYDQGQTYQGQIPQGQTYPSQSYQGQTYKGRSPEDRAHSYQNEAQHPAMSGNSTGLAKQNPNREPVFNELDANQDGYVSSDEAKQYSPMLRQWNSLDKNHDRRLDRSEFSAFEPRSSTGGASNSSSSPGAQMRQGQSNAPANSAYPSR